MTPAQIKANLDRFNEASQSAQEGLGRLKTWIEGHEPDPDLMAALELYLTSVDVMISTSSELIGITGPMAPSSQA